jgi:SAM-dependent methyltransferase
VLTQNVRTADPTVLAATLGARPSAVDRRVVEKLGSRIARRRRWALHRHVHLVAAFEHARSVAPVRTFLGAGCGAGASELFLAATNPDVVFTLADFDASRLAIARDVSEAFGLTNVRYRTLDLLDEPDGERFDFVSSIEVLEHIADDRTAARNLLAHSGAFAYVLVPHCDEDELVNPLLCAMVWRNHEHHRPGYTRRTFADLFDGSEVLVARNCYFMPEGEAFRRRLVSTDDDDIIRRWPALMAEAADDIRDRFVDDGARGARGIEALVRVSPAPHAAGARPQVIPAPPRRTDLPPQAARRPGPLGRLRDGVIETRAAIVFARS